MTNEQRPQRTPENRVVRIISLIVGGVVFTALGALFATGLIALGVLLWRFILGG